MQPQSVVLPLRLDVDVFSGIAPPPQLLQAMADTKANAKHPLRTNTSATVEQLRTQSHRQTTHSEPATPVDEAGPSQAQFAPPQRGPDEPRYEDAPPSYEDAIATDMPSMDAPRPEYAPPPPNEDDGFLGDEKKDRRSMREV